MHLLVNLTAILDLKDIADPLIHVSPDLWDDLNDTYPEHCYGNSSAFDSRTYLASGSGYSDIPYHYRVDLRGILGWVGHKEAVAVSKDQWMAIASNPEWRKFCFGGETKSVLAKKQDTSEKPRDYDNWLSGIDYVCKLTDEFGRKYVRRKVALDNWKDEGRSAKDFAACEAYAIAKGDLFITRENGFEFLVLTETLNA